MGSVATEFITHLSLTRLGYDAITTYVDRFTKRFHFCACRTSDNCIKAAQNFLSTVIRLHDMPDTIAWDRDPKFTSSFWKYPMKLFGIRLKMSTSYHPPTDGSSDIMNRPLEN